MWIRLEGRPPRPRDPPALHHADRQSPRRPAANPLLPQTPRLSRGLRALPVANVRGVHLHYAVLGERGPWVALQPGGRRALGGVKSLGEKLAEAGCRVLVYDRRNCGASGGSFDGGSSEDESGGGGRGGLLSHVG